MTNSLVPLPPNVKIAEDSLIKKKEKKLVMGSMDKNKREEEDWLGRILPWKWCRVTSSSKVKTFVKKALQKASQYILSAKIIKALKILDRDSFWIIK